VEKAQDSIKKNTNRNDEETEKLKAEIKKLE